MNKTVIKTKKQTDFELLRKLEDEYDEAVEDLQNKEEILIKSVHGAYLKADNKREFFNNLSKSESWYYDKFRLHSLETSRPDLSDASVQVHAERKVDDFVSMVDDDCLLNTSIDVDSNCIRRYI